jgi:hypothetical protein
MIRLCVMPGPGLTWSEHRPTPGAPWIAGSGPAMTDFEVR